MALSLSPLPSSGASAQLSATAVTIGSNGVASVTATANATAGSYTVTASAPGVAGSLDFDLTNNLIPLSFSGLTDQSITYGTPSVTITGTLADGSLDSAGRDRRRDAQRHPAVGDDQLQRCLLHNLQHVLPRRIRLALHG